MKYTRGRPLFRSQRAVMSGRGMKKRAREEKREITFALMLSFAAALLFFPTDLSRSAQLSRSRIWANELCHSLMSLAKGKTCARFRAVWRFEMIKFIAASWTFIKLYASERECAPPLSPENYGGARHKFFVSNLPLEVTAAKFPPPSHSLGRHKPPGLALKPQNAVKLQHQHTHGSKMRDGWG